MAAQYSKYPVTSGGGGGGVSSLNTLTGALTLVAGSGITITPSGSNITIAATGGGGGADQALDNLTSPTAINQDLIFNKATPIVKSQDTTGTTVSQTLTLTTGNASGNASSGDFFAGSGTTSGTAFSKHSGNSLFGSGNSIGSGSGKSGGATFKSGDTTGGSGITGSVFLGSGDVDANVSGSITISSGIPDKANPGGSSGSGGLSIKSSDVSQLGDSGNVSVNTGSTNGGNPGSLVVQPGTANAGGSTGATLSIHGGDADNIGGNTIVVGGTALSGIGGDLHLDGGAGPTQGRVLITGSSLTFNGSPLTSGGITSLTGDATATGPGSAALTLATVNSNVGAFGSSTSIPSFTVNAKGLITAASGNAVIAPASTLTGATLASGITASSLTSLGTQAQALNMGSHQINAVTDPTSAQDAATKNYVDTTSANQTLSNLTNPTSINQNLIFNKTAATVATKDIATTGTSTDLFLQTGISGNGAANKSGNAWLLTGNSLGTGVSANSGAVNVNTGASTNGNTGAVEIASGDASARATGSIDLLTGTAGTNSGGITLTTGGATGTRGSIILSAQALTFNGANVLTSNSIIPIADGGTGQTSKAPAFDALQPMTTGGDLIYGGASGTGTRLPNGTAGQVLTSAGGTAAPTWSTPSAGATGSYAQAYHTQATSWSTASASYTDPLPTGTPALTVRQSSGITLTAAGGSPVRPGIAFTPASASAVYLVIAIVNTMNSLGDSNSLRLTDGTTTIVQADTQTFITGNMSVTLSGIFVPGTTSPVEVDVQLATNNGTASISFDYLGNPIEWTVIRIF